MESPPRHAGAPPDPAAAAGQPLRIYYARGGRVGRLREPPDCPWDALCRQVREAGFNLLLTDPLWLRAPGSADSPVPLDLDRPDPGFDDGPELEASLRRLAARGADRGVAVLMDLVLDRVAVGPDAARHDPDWYRAPAHDPARDPRTALAERGVRHLRAGPLPPAFIHAWSERLARWLDAGLGGFRCDAPQRIGADDWHALLAPLRAAFPDRLFLSLIHI